MKKFVVRGLVLVGLLTAAYCLRGELVGAAGSVSRVIGIASPTVGWPPRLDEEYPELELIDQEGNLTRLSDFRGQPILIEPIGMNCPGCQAFCGGQKVGGFGGVKPQSGLASIDRLAARYGGFKLDRLVHVHLLLYDLQMQAPTADDAKAWAEHFGMDRSKNQIVLVAKGSMLGDESYDMIPGFQFVDEDFILRSDSTGHQPQHDLYRELLPMVGKALSPTGEKAPARKLIVREF